MENTSEAVPTANRSDLHSKVMSVYHLLVALQIQIHPHQFPLNKIFLKCVRCKRPNALPLAASFLMPFFGQAMLDVSYAQ